MKFIYYISLSVLSIAFLCEGFSQNQRQEAYQNKSEIALDRVSSLTERAKIKNEEISQTPTHITWERIVYRNIDLTKEANAPLYYPIQPLDNHMNLFTLIFKLMMNGKIKAYNYLDGREIFTDDQKVDFENILKKYQILYSIEDNRFIIEDNDIPSSEATMYMIKEGYYFDQATGTFKSTVLAICPLLVREDYYYGGITKDPLFWITYDELRPYISREMIMTSNYNNVLTLTIDDYFRKGMYRGNIVKTTNLMGKSLIQEIGTDTTALEHAQDSIETQLKTFDKKLWIYNDSIYQVVQTSKNKKTIELKLPARHNNTNEQKPNSLSKSKASLKQAEGTSIKNIRKKPQ